MMRPRCFEQLGGIRRHCSIYAMFDPVASCKFDANKVKEEFNRSGFVVVDRLITAEVVEGLNQALNEVLSGKYNLGRAPDKIIPKDFFQNNHVQWRISKKTVQVVNIWKANNAFSELVLSTTLGKFVADLGGWQSGARVANDQIWAKSPGSGPLSFHRDSSYFDFVPSEVITVWLALDDMVPEVGPLEYVRGSQAWDASESGVAKQFFPKETNRWNLLKAAAKAEGKDFHELEIVAANVLAGGGSIHDGRIWHGSAGNRSTANPRRGLGIHFIPANSKFKPGADSCGKLWKKFKVAGTELLPEEHFPTTFQRVKKDDISC